MNLTRRISFWIVLIITLVASGWWILHVPYRPERVFEAIPSAATLVSVHHNLAGEWDHVFNNPLLLRPLKASGLDEDKLTGVSTNRVIRQWAERLASDRTIVAYVPAMGAESKPALIASSWIGNQSRLLRWQMAWVKTRDLTPVYLDDGNITIWLSREKFGNTNLRLSMALSEGLVLACISEDPLGVRVLLESAEKYPYRHTVADQGKPAFLKTRVPGTPRHSGWVNIGQHPMAFQLDLKPDSLKLELHGSDPFLPAVNLKELPGTSTALSLIGKTSDIAFLLPMSWISAMIPAEPPFMLLKNLKDLMAPRNTPTNALAFVALLDQDHNGRIRGPINKNLRGLIKGVKAPSLLIGLQVQDDAEADNRMSQLIKTFNSQYGLELQAGPYEPENNTRITSILEQSHSFYSKFEPEEQVAYTVKGNWLILASNGAVLRQLLTQSANSGKNDWQLDSGLDLSASAWVNLNGVGLTVKNAAGVAKLATMLSSTDRSKSIRAQLEQLDVAASVLRELGQARITLHSTNDGLRAKIVIGSIAN